jgi:heme/copper-type cytochrome/quinol oxidase subunit 3
MRSIIYERAGLADTTHDGSPVISSKRLAFTLYIALTIMLFAGLFGGWFVLKGNNEIWPPTGTPEMSIVQMIPENLTMIISLILLYIAMSNLKKADFGKFGTYVFSSAVVSILFVFAMAMEIWRLLAGGVSMSTVFGGMYFIIIGVFLTHYIGGIIALFRFSDKAKRFPAAHGIKIGFSNTMNWHYLMLALWICIVVLIYM